MLLQDVARSLSGRALGADVGAGEPVVVQIKRQQKLSFVAFLMR